MSNMSEAMKVSKIGPLAGQNPRSRSVLPGTRGDGPRELWKLFNRAVCSPHARGWALQPMTPERARAVLPVRVGMDPFTATA